MSATSERAARRGAGIVLFQPPEAAVRERAWHMVETHLGLRRLQWRPGIDVWRGEESGERWTAEFGGQYRWKYVSIALDQTGGLA
jgi:hypothetical protein